MTSGAFSYGTGYQESEAILAAQQEDYTTVVAVLDAMLPGELTALRRACYRLANMIETREVNGR